MFDKVYEAKGFKKLYDELNEESLYTLYQKIDFSEDQVCTSPAHDC